MSDSLGPPGAGPADESIGALLSRVRLEQGKSQLRVAERLCAASGLATITRHEISRWEREERIPGSMWLRWLAVVLDCSLDELERAAAVARERREATVMEMTTMTTMTTMTSVTSVARMVTGIPAHEGGSGPPRDLAPPGSAAQWSSAEREARRARLMDLRRMDDLVAGPELAGVVQRELRGWLADAGRFPAATPGSRADRERLGLIAGLAQLTAWVTADAGAPAVAFPRAAPGPAIPQAAARGAIPPAADGAAIPPAVAAAVEASTMADGSGVTTVSGPDAAMAAFRLGLRAADRAGDRPLAGHLLGCLAQVIAEDGDHRAALRLARSAQRRAGSTATSGVRSLLALRVAYAAAVGGLRRECEEALAVAERATDRATERGAEQRDPGLDPDWLYWFDAAHFAALAGRCHAALGRPATARPLLESALRTRSLRYRAAAITGSALAVACVDAGDLAEAAAAATDALVACVQSGSVRAGRALRAVDHRVARAARAAGATRGGGWSAMRDYLHLVDAARPYLPTLSTGPVSKRGGAHSISPSDRHTSILQDAREEPRRAGGQRPG